MGTIWQAANSCWLCRMHATENFKKCCFIACVACKVRQRKPTFVRICKPTCKNFKYTSQFKYACDYFRTNMLNILTRTSELPNVNKLKMLIHVNVKLNVISVSLCYVQLYIILVENSTIYIKLLEEAPFVLLILENCKTFFQALQS